MNFTFDAKTHTYRLDGKRMTGVTTILGVLNKPALVPWAARMASEYIAEGTLGTLQEGLDEGSWNLSYLKKLFEEAKTAYAKKRDEGAEKGTDTHALVESFINSQLTGNISDIDYKPIQPFIDWAKNQNVKFLGSEVQMYSKELFVAGTADFVFEKDGKTYIGDIKTYKKIWDRTPFYQCAGYALMWEEMNGVIKEPSVTEFGKVLRDTANLDKQISGYVIFNLPKEREHNPEEDVLWSFDTEGDTKAFLACVEIYRQNARFIKPNYKNKK